MTDEEKFENIMKQLKDLLGKKDEPKSLKLEVGKVYKDTKGIEVLIVYHSKDGKFCGFNGLDHWFYEEDGIFEGRSKVAGSLVEELPGLDITNWWKDE